MAASIFAYPIIRTFGVTPDMVDLALGVGTVSRAYAEAERRGLISSHVGRGSFITDGVSPRLGDEQGRIADLAHNLPPLAPSERRMSEGLARLRQRADLDDSVGYSPPEGLAAVRAAGAAWLRRRHGLSRATSDGIIQCNGGQHGLALAFSALARPGDTILCEAATYPGIRTLADHCGYRLAGVAMDDRGIDPEAIARAARESGARVLVLIPTLQNPTTLTLDAGRRDDIVKVARALDLTIVEDEAYRLFADAGCPPSFSDLAPERSLMVAGISKSVAPGLRLGFILPPDDGALRERLVRGIRAFGYSPPTLGGLVFAQWEQDGIADRIADDVLIETQARTELALRILGAACMSGCRCPWSMQNALPRGHFEPELPLRRQMVRLSIPRGLWASGCALAPCGAGKRSKARWSV